MNNRRFGTAPLAAGIALLASGCTVGPNFHPPEPPDVATYESLRESAENPAAENSEQRIALGKELPAQWWRLFHSKPLEDTVGAAIAGNNSLVAARANLAAANETIIQARAASYPQIDFGSGASRSTGNFGTISNLFSFGPSATFSPDLFGGTRRRVEQAKALAENERYQLAAAYLTLTGAAVTEAITAASTRLEIATVQNVVKNDQKNLDLVQNEFTAGKAAKVDVLTAEAQLESDLTLLPTLHQELSAAQHALSILAGKAPAQWSAPDFNFDDISLPEELPMSLPSQLIHRRPDILAAESQLHADSAAIGIATAELYPTVTLSASIVQAASILDGLLQAASRAWSLAAGAGAPLFHGRALESQKRQAVDIYNGQLATYRQTVLAAFGQVADSLQAIENDGSLVNATKRARDISKNALDLQRGSYTAGKSSVLQLIVAENTSSQALLAYVRAEGQRLQDSVQLFIAAGGGWWNARDVRE